MSDAPPEVAACVEGARRGDDEAARRLVQRCHPLVLRIVRAHLPRTLGEDDLAQEVYLRMFARLERYEPRPDVPFEHWLSRLAVRTCLDALRAESRRPLGRAVPLSPGAEEWLRALGGTGEPPVDDALAARELALALLARLPPGDRLVLNLLDLQDRSTAEVAELTGWSPVLVRVRAFRARRRLRAAARSMAVPGARR